MTTEETKRCSQCDEVKPISGFQKDHKSPNPHKRRAHCNACDARRRRENRQRAKMSKVMHKPSSSVVGIKVPMTEIEYQRRLRAAENMR